MISPVNSLAGQSNDATTDDRPILAVLSGDGVGPGTPTTQWESSVGSTPNLGNSSSAFVINIVWDSSVANAPVGFTTDVTAAVQYLETQFHDPVTININVGYGEVAGSPLGSGALGESSTFLSSFSYAQIYNALVADAKTSADATAIANLLTTDPVSGTHNYWVATAEAKALGLLGPSSNVDGYVGFSSSANIFDYDNSNGVSAGTYDFYGVVLHELTEVMGRQMMDGQTFVGNPAYEPLDLFHYSAPGARLFTGTTTGYFSIDGGVTNLDNFNTNSGGDFGDWAASAGHDAMLAFSNSGVVNAFTPADLKAMDVLGWDATVPHVSEDFNGDGKSDLLWQNSGGGVAMWQMNGNQITGLGVGSLPSDWHAVGVGDFNGDGKSDILWQNNNGGVAIWQMNGNQITAALGVGSLPSDWHVMGLGDFNGDGKSDILWQNDNGGVAIWEMNGNQITTAIGLGSLPSDWHIVGIGDFNGDGKSDILWQNNNGGVAIWQMNGNQISALGVGSLPSDWHVIGVGDFNGDSKSDILWQNSNGGVAIWQMNGNQISAALAVGSLPSDWHAIAFGDYNGDGKSDIVWQNNNGGVAVWEMNGNQIAASLGVGSLTSDWTMIPHQFDLIA